MRITNKDITVSDGCSFCPEEHLFNFGPVCKANRIGYMRLRFGSLVLYPVEKGEILFSEPVYRKKFYKDDWKGQFDCRERSKYIRKCTRKIVRWYNRNHKNTNEPI